MSVTTTLRALLAAATPGPWNADRRHPTDGDIAYVDGVGGSYDEIALLCCGEGSSNHADAALITAAISTLPRLLDVVEAAEANDFCIDEKLRHGRGSPTEVQLRRALAALKGSGT